MQFTKMSKNGHTNNSDTTGSETNSTALALKLPNRTHANLPRIRRPLTDLSVQKCTTVSIRPQLVTSQVHHANSNFDINSDGLLVQPLTTTGSIQISVQLSLWQRILIISHQQPITRNPGQRHMYNTLHRRFQYNSPLWPLTVARLLVYARTAQKSTSTTAFSV